METINDSKGMKPEAEYYAGMRRLVDAATNKNYGIPEYSVARKAVGHMSEEDFGAIANTMYEVFAKFTDGERIDIFEAYIGDLEIWAWEAAGLPDEGQEQDEWAERVMTKVEAWVVIRDLFVAVAE